jgi:hypothetical protein
LPASLGEVETSLASLEGHLLILDCPYWLLRGREQLVAVRQRRQADSRLLLRRAQAYGRLIARLPFVRMVALTGSLAVENSDAGDDLDYLIVTERGRVWLTRALIMTVVRLAGLKGTTVCPNYILSESALALPERDYYTARELLQMRPISGASVYGRMLDLNSWWRDFLPNAAPAAGITPGAGHASLTRRVAESALRTPPGTLLERWLMQRKSRELASQDGSSDETAFDAEVCKGHFEGYRRLTRERVAQRMRELQAVEA